MSVESESVYISPSSSSLRCRFIWIHAGETKYVSEKELNPKGETNERDRKEGAKIISNKTSWHLFSIELSQQHIQRSNRRFFIRVHLLISCVLFAIPLSFVIQR